MQRALVVVDDTETDDTLLREAGDLAAGTGADLVLLAPVTESEFDQDYEAIERIAETENTSYSSQDVLDVIRRSTQEDAAAAFEGMDVAYETVVTVIEPDERADEITDTADRMNCDHVFIAGQERSPTRKAVFGDAAQSVILNFDGPVTILTA